MVEQIRRPELVTRYDANFSKKKREDQRDKKEQEEFKIPATTDEDIVEVRSIQTQSTQENNLPTSSKNKENKSRTEKHKIDVIV